jgi:hypothetical protein
MAGKCLALLIGNSVFEENSGFRPLRCSAADVEAFANARPCLGLRLGSHN